jgi:hypothetical protein
MTRKNRKKRFKKGFVHEIKSFFYTYAALSAEKVFPPAKELLNVCSKKTVNGWLLSKKLSVNIYRCFTNIDFLNIALKTKKVSLKIRQFLSPFSVRVESPSVHFIHSTGISLLFAAAVIFAAQIASSQAVPAALTEKTVDNKNIENSEPYIIRTKHKKLKILKQQNKEPKKKPKSVNFYNPYYIFIDSDSQDIKAYPLADPPGIIVNINGADEPVKSAAEMVGRDKRIKEVKRRVTKKGIRYILKISSPLKRIKTTRDGGVIIITPVK